MKTETDLTNWTCGKCLFANWEMDLERGKCECEFSERIVVRYNYPICGYFLSITDS